MAVWVGVGAWLAFPFVGVAVLYAVARIFDLSQEGSTVRRFARLLATCLGARGQDAGTGRY